MKHGTIILAAVLVLFGAANLSAGFNRTEGFDKCGGTISVKPGLSNIGTFFGDWYEFASSASVSGSGVTATLGTKMNGAQNSSRGEGMIGSVEIRITASDNAAAGNRTLTIRFPNGGTDQFTINVVAMGSITGQTIPTLDLGFTRVRVVFTGVNLSSANSVSARTVQDAFNPNSAVAGGQVPGTHTSQIVSSNGSSVTIDLLSNVGLEKITMDITIRGGSICDGYPTVGLQRRITLQAAQPSQPFITRISMPQQGGSVTLGSIANFEIQLNKPAPASPIKRLTTIRPVIGRPSFDFTQLGTFTQGTIIYWRVAPPESVEGVSGDVPYSRNVVLNQMVVPTGETIKRFKLKIVAMPAGGGARQGTAILQTWIGNTNVNTAPEYFEFPFTIVNPN